MVYKDSQPNYYDFTAICTIQKSLGTLPVLLIFIYSGDCNTEFSFKPNSLFRTPNLSHVLHEKDEIFLRYMFMRHVF